jgi:serine/threonine-protein kinase
MENWGLLWMAHSGFTLMLCALTQALHALDPAGRVPLMLLWTVGLLTWSGIFWQLRRRAGPVTFVERQIAHAWAAGVAGTIGVLVLEILLKRPVLELAPVLGVVAGMIFLFMAGILSGMFYFAVAALFAAGGVMALVPGWAMLIYGVTLAACYFIPGFHYWRQRRRARAAAKPRPDPAAR